jgi:hypothetical protein
MHGTCSIWWCRIPRTSCKYLTMRYIRIQYSSYLNFFARPISSHFHLPDLEVQDVHSHSDCRFHFDFASLQARPK